MILVFVEDGTYAFLALSDVSDLRWIVASGAASLFASCAVKSEPEALLLIDFAALGHCSRDWRHF